MGDRPATGASPVPALSRQDGVHIEQAVAVRCGRLPEDANRETRDMPSEPAKPLRTPDPTAPQVNAPKLLDGLGPDPRADA